MNERDLRIDGEVHARVDVILEIIAHRQIGDHRNSEFLQVIGRTDAGEHEQLGGVDRTGAQYDLSSREHRVAHAEAIELHADRSLVVREQHLGHIGEREDVQVLSASSWPQKRFGGRAAGASSYGALQSGEREKEKTVD